MTANRIAIGYCIILSTIGVSIGERWSRQIQPNEGDFVSVPGNDWVPLNRPDRQAAGRVLNFAPLPHHQQPYAPHVFQNGDNRQPQQIHFGAGEPFQVVGQQRFLLPPQQQAQQMHYQIHQQQLPQQQIQQQPQQQLPPQQQQQQQQHQHAPPILSFQQLPPPLSQQQNLPQLPLDINQHFQFQQHLPQPENHQFFLQPQKPAFLQGEVPQDIQKPQPEQLIHHPQFVFDQEQKLDLEKVNPQQQDEVQLLYVPLDTLYHQKNQQQQQQQYQNNKYNVIPSPVNPSQINEFYTPQSITTPTPVPTTTTRTQYTSPNHRFSTAFTEKPKVKSHQPPLAMFMLNDVSNPEISINDVLSALKNAKNIDVLDSASKKSPKVFVGPSGLRTPDGYTKFELPYLSSIEQNRAERQIGSLPFFVAPLSYRAPKGFAKIPLPAPHVGSVVVNSPTNSIESVPEKDYDKNYFSIMTQRPQVYPKKVQYMTPSTEIYKEQKPEKSEIYREYSSSIPQKPTTRHNLGFRFGSDVFTTTTPTPFRDVSTPNSYAHEVSSTPKPYFPEVSSTRNPFSNYQEISSTPSPYREISSTRNPYHEVSSIRNFLNQEISSTRSPHQEIVSSTRAPANRFQTSYRQSVVSSTPQIETAFQNADVSAYENFKPLPTGQHVLNEEYFNVPNKKVMDSFSNEKPDKTNEYFATVDKDKVNQFLPFQPTNDYYNVPSASTTTSPEQKEESDSFGAKSKESDSKLEVPSYTSRPIEYSTKAQEIQKMKSYYKEQDAYKKRPQLPSPSSTARPIQQTVSYSPVTSSYERDENQFFSSTPDFFASFFGTDLTTESNNIERNPSSTPTIISGPPNRVTYFTPTPNYDDTPAVHNFKFVESVVNRDYDYQNRNSTTSDKSAKQDSENGKKYQTIDANNREQDSNYGYTSPSPYKESTVKHVPVKKTYKEYSVEDDDAYNLPSELPQISANLPGLVNSLFEAEKMQSNGKASSTVEPPSTVPKRTSARTRRPVATRASTSSSATTSSTSSYLSADTTTRRAPTSRGRRPIHYANRTTTVRSPTARNPNRVRYNPSPEERQRFRSRTKGKGKDEDLEYQRDVLKQNYPVVSRGGQTTTPPPQTETEITEKYTTASSYAHETEKMRFDEDDTYVVPPNHSKNVREKLLTVSSTTPAYDRSIPEQFLTMQDHLQIPQVHQLDGKNTFSMNFFPEPEDQNINVEIINDNNKKVDIRPVFISSTQQSTTTSTTEAIVDLDNEPQKVKRPTFVKRTQRPLTTTPPSVATTNLPEKHLKERYTIRPKSRYDSTTVTTTSQPRTTKLRNGRVRRPSTIPPSTLPTTTISPEVETYIDDSYQQISRFNKDFYQETPSPAYKRPSKNDNNNFRITISPLNDQKKYKYDQRTRFALETQESQWSTHLNQDSFRPIDPKSSKSLKDASSSSLSTEESDIVTAGTDIESNGDTYLFNVAPDKNFVSFGTDTSESKLNPTVVEQYQSNDTASSESSLVDLLEQAMSDLSNDIVKKQEGLEDRREVFSTVTRKSTSQDNVAGQSEKKSKRRGVWKRVRVRPVDSFETAESQNIGKQYYNTILSDNAKELSEKYAEKGELGVEIREDDEDDNEHHHYHDHSYDTDRTSFNIYEVVTSQSEDAVAETTTVHSPGDIDLGTGSPIIDLHENDTNILTTENDLIPTTDLPSSFEEITTIVPDEDELILSTTMQSKKLASETEEVTTIKPDDQKDSTEKPFYDDYDMEFKSDKIVNKNSSEKVKDEAIVEDQVPESSSIMDEVKQKLTDLFSFTADDYDYQENNLRPKMQQYTTIERTRPSRVSKGKTENEPIVEAKKVQKEEKIDFEPAAVTEAAYSFHKDLMDSVVYATSTSTEISHETEICYRGRCIKTDRKQ